MNSSKINGVVVVVALALACARTPPRPAPAATSSVVEAANAFLATLDATQRANVVYAYTDDQQRARWSNFPTAVVPRGGVALKDMTDVQRTAALAMLASALSPRGLEKVEQIMGGDEVLKTTDGGNGPGGPGPVPPGSGSAHVGGGPPPWAGGPPPFGPGQPPFRGGKDLFGKDLYYVSILGTPAEGTPWMLQFGGHHLALNLTINGERGTLAPTLTGAQPALYESHGQTVRPLGAENDKGFALLRSLDAAQREKAILAYRVADLVLGPGHDGETIPPEGVKASSMNASQRELLLDLMAEWAGIASDRFAAARMVELKADLDETWFAWSGPTTVEPGKNGSAYYRIQGPRVVIEYAPQGQRDDAATHIHTMYRDPTYDYGRAPHLR